MSGQISLKTKSPQSCVFMLSVTSELGLQASFPALRPVPAVSAGSLLLLLPFLEGATALAWLWTRERTENVHKEFE